MWTLCWIDKNGNDRWDRLTKDELKEKLKELEDSIGLEDILIFPPDTEIPPEDIL